MTRPGSVKTVRPPCSLSAARRGNHPCAAALALRRRARSASAPAQAAARPEAGLDRRRRRTARERAAPGGSAVCPPAGAGAAFGAGGAPAALPVAALRLVAARGGGVSAPAGGGGAVRVAVCRRCRRRRRRLAAGAVLLRRGRRMRRRRRRRRRMAPRPAVARTALAAAGRRCRSAEQFVVAAAVRPQAGGAAAERRSAGAGCAGGAAAGGGWSAAAVAPLRRWRRRWRRCRCGGGGGGCGARRGGGGCGGGGAAEAAVARRRRRRTRRWRRCSGGRRGSRGGGAALRRLLGLSVGTNFFLGACATTSGAVCACDGEAIANCVAVSAVVASSTRRRFVMMVWIPGNSAIEQLWRSTNRRLGRIVAALKADICIYLQATPDFTMRVRSLRIQATVSDRNFTSLPAGISAVSGNRSGPHLLVRHFRSVAGDGARGPCGPRHRQFVGHLARQFLRRGGSPGSRIGGGTSGLGLPGGLSGGGSVGLPGVDRRIFLRFDRHLHRHLAIVADIGPRAGDRGCGHLHIADDGARRIPELGIVGRDLQHADIRILG